MGRGAVREECGLPQRHVGFERTAWTSAQANRARSDGVEERWGAPRGSPSLRRIREEVRPMYFVKYQDNRREWRWTLYAANHEAIMVSSEGYVHEAGCDHSIALVKRDVHAAEVRRRAA